MSRSGEISAGLASTQLSLPEKLIGHVPSALGSSFTDSDESLRTDKSTGRLITDDLGVSRSSQR